MKVNNTINIKDKLKKLYTFKDNIAANNKTTIMIIGYIEYLHFSLNLLKTKKDVDPTKISHNLN